MKIRAFHSLHSCWGVTTCKGRRLLADATNGAIRINSFNKRVSESKPLLISLEGNIGAGKSTILKSLKSSKPEWVFIDEPLAFWTSVVNDDGKNLLETFYSDVKRWSFTFQACALLSRFQNIENQLYGSLKSTGDAKLGSALSLRERYIGADEIVESRLSQSVSRVFITERSLQTDYEVFTKMLVASGNINFMELAVYKNWYDMLLNASTPLAGIVHVHQTPEECLNRIKQRHRKGEDSISLDYLKDLDGSLRNWISRSNCPVHSVTTGLPGELTENFDENNSHVLAACTKQIIQFIDGLQKKSI